MRRPSGRGDMGGKREQANELSYACSWMHMDKWVCSGPTVKNGDPKILQPEKSCNPPYPENPIRDTGGQETPNLTKMRKNYSGDLLLRMVLQSP